MLSTASNLDALVANATSDPYDHTKLPRLAVLATSSTSLLYTGVSGYAQLPEEPSPLEGAEKLTLDTPFTLWSSTKLVTSLSALQLIEQGKVKLDDDASKYLPELKAVKLLKGFEGEKPILVENEKVITVEMLLNHTAGFTYEFNGEYFTKYQLTQGLDTVYGPGNSRKCITAMPLMYEPGARWHYGLSNDWLGFLIEAVSGLELGAYFQKFIFGPLGITDISFEAPSNAINQAYYEAGTTKRSKAGANLTFGPQKAGGAGLYGPASSYIKILQTLLPSYAGPAILSPSTISKVFQPTLTDPTQLEDLGLATIVQDPYTQLEGKPCEGNNWGLAGCLSGKVLKSGRSKGIMTWAGAAGTFWVVDRDNDIAFLVWTEMWPFGPAQFYKIWADIEIELYKGIGVEGPKA